MKEVEDDEKDDVEDDENDDEKDDAEDDEEEEGETKNGRGSGKEMLDVNFFMQEAGVGSIKRGLPSCHHQSRPHDCGSMEGGGGVRA